jgi:DNA-binding transcriptional MerR regulator
MSRLPEKLYYRIGETAEYLQVEPSTLRFWEKEFNLRPKRKNNERFYTRQDIETFELIRYLLKEEKYTLEGARQKLKQKKQAVKEKKDLIEALENLKKELTEIKRRL